MKNAQDPVQVEAVIAAGPSDRDIERIREAVEQVASGAAPADPTWGEYFIAQVGRAVSWLADALGFGGPTLLLAFRLFGWLLIALASVLVVWFVVRWFARRSSGEPVSMAALLDPVGEPEVGEDLRLRLEKEIERALAEGRVQGLTNRIWRWLQLSLFSSSQVQDPSTLGDNQVKLTGRELLASTRRMDLLPQVRELERLTWGPEAAEAQALARSFDLLRSRVAQSPTPADDRRLP